MKYIIAMLLVVSGIANAGQVSVSTVGVASPNAWNYASQDFNIQYSHGEKNYMFVSYELMKICPYYCGVNYSIIGLGGGIRKNIGPVTLFAQAGYFYVHNNIGYDEKNENIYYYMVNRFNGGKHLDFSGYRVDNGNALGASIGLDIPFTESAGMKFYYRHLQFWTNYVAYLEDGGYWHDPATLKYSGYGFGAYYNF